MNSQQFTSVDLAQCAVGFQAVTEKLSTPDLYALGAAVLNALDQRGEDINPDLGRIQGDAASVVWNTATERYAVDVHEDAVGIADYYTGTTGGTLTVLADGGGVAEIMSVEVHEDAR